ncbi:aminoglycoside phosphotransferase family protein [Dactylosporangium sp. CA-052675]|uniref:aminoglycoside phosphotransferase family protein n=1 Tax=Dactylosporangium sp. CA-052675 TaxID=3239927 RepID=UPI003D8A8BD1
MITPALRRNVTATWGEPGARWLDALPETVAAVAGDWGLSVGAPFDLSYHYVAAATTADGEPAVLKLGVPGGGSLEEESRALAAFGGRGAVHLLRSDLGRGALLIERAEPGERARDRPDAEATAAVADAMRALHVPVPDRPAPGRAAPGRPAIAAVADAMRAPHAPGPDRSAPPVPGRSALPVPGRPVPPVPERPAIAAVADAMRAPHAPAAVAAAAPVLPDVLGQVRAFDAHLARFPGDDPLPRAFVSTAAGLMRELCASAPSRVLLHGDLHHDNLLSARRARWLAIDPHGLSGDPGYEIGSWLFNPDPGNRDPALLALVPGRLEQFADRLGQPLDRLVAWGFVKAVLSDVWTAEHWSPGDARTPASRALDVATLLRPRLS